MIHMYSIPAIGFWFIATPAKIVHSTTCQRKTAHFMAERMLGLKALGTYAVGRFNALPERDKKAIGNCGAAWASTFIKPNLEVHYFEMEGSGLDRASQELVDLFIDKDEYEVLSLEKSAIMVTIPYVGYWEISAGYGNIRIAPDYNRKTAQLFYEFIERNKAGYFEYWTGYHFDYPNALPLELDGVTWLSREEYEHEYAYRLRVPLSRLPVHFANLLEHGNLNPKGKTNL